MLAPRRQKGERMSNDVVGFEDLYQGAHKHGRGVELSATLAFGLGELVQEILIDLPQ